MKFRTVQFDCLACRFNYRFKVRVPDHCADLATMERRAVLTDCPRCQEILEIREVVARRDRHVPLNAPADPVLHGEG